MAMATVRALRSAAGVTMSRGRIPRLVMASRQSTIWSGNSVRRRGSSEGGRHHVQRLEPQDGDEGLHGVVGEHAPAAALAGAGVEGEAGPDLVVLVGHLERRHEIDAVTRRRVDPGPDGAVGEDDGGRVVLEHGGDGPDGGLVAGHDGDEAGDAVRGQVDVGDIVDELAPDEGEPHLRRAVELAVRHAQGEGGRDQADRQVVRGDPAGQRFLDGLHLLRHAEIALAVAEVADHGPHRVVDLVDVLTEEFAVPTRWTSRPGLMDTSVDVGSVSLCSRIQTSGRIASPGVAGLRCRRRGDGTGAGRAVPGSAASA